MTTTKISAPTGDRKSWRDAIKVHPAAAAYPRLSADELAELAGDIKARGLEVDVVLFREGGKDLLLDGISRLDALESNGVDLVGKDGKLDRTLGLGGGGRVRVVADVDPVAMAASLNAHRRHLSAEDKRKHIETLLKANPEKSDRQLAKVAKVHNETVAAVRKQVEARDGIRHVEKRTDTRGREQPARKTATKTATRSEAKKAAVEPGMPRLMADLDRVKAILLERIGLEGLTLVWAASMVCEGALCLNDTINAPGTDGAEVFAKMTAGEFTIKDFFAKYSGKGGELGEAKRALEIKIKGYESEIADLQNELRDLKAAATKAQAKKKSVTAEKLAEADDPFHIPPEYDRTKH